MWSEPSAARAGRGDGSGDVDGPRRVDDRGPESGFGLGDPVAGEVAPSVVHLALVGSREDALEGLGDEVADAVLHLRQASIAGAHAGQAREARIAGAVGLEVDGNAEGEERE